MYQITFKFEPGATQFWWPQYKTAAISLSGQACASFVQFGIVTTVALFLHNSVGQLLGVKRVHSPVLCSKLTKHSWNRNLLEAWPNNHFSYQRRCKKRNKHIPDHWGPRATFACDQLASTPLARSPKLLCLAKQASKLSCFRTVWYHFPWCFWVSQNEINGRKVYPKHPETVLHQQIFFLSPTFWATSYPTKDHLLRPQAQLCPGWVVAHWFYSISVELIILDVPWKMGSMLCPKTKGPPFHQLHLRSNLSQHLKSELDMDTKKEPKSSYNLIQLSDGHPWPIGIADLAPRLRGVAFWGAKASWRCERPAVRWRAFGEVLRTSSVVVIKIALCRA